MANMEDMVGLEHTSLW